MGVTAGATIAGAAARALPRPGGRVVVSGATTRLARRGLAALGARLGAAAGVAALAACQPDYGPTTAHVKMQGSPPDAVVIVDDRPVGTLAAVARRGLAVEPGKHRVSVERAGYFPWDAEIEADERPVQLNVRLDRVPE